MKLEMFAIWDDKAKAFMQPFFMMSKPLAVRTFANAVNKPDSQIGVNPEDYTLFHLGNFDDGDGAFKVGPPELVCSGLQMRKVQ